MTAEVYLIRVIADDRSGRLWAAATARDEAIDRVLDEIPEGWTARLLGERLTVHEATFLQMSAGEIRELRET